MEFALSVADGKIPDVTDDGDGLTKEHLSKELLDIVVSLRTEKDLFKAVEGMTAVFLRYDTPHWPEAIFELARV